MDYKGNTVGVTFLLGQVQAERKALAVQAVTVTTPAVATVALFRADLYKVAYMAAVAAADSTAVEVAHMGAAILWVVVAVALATYILQY